MKIKTLVGTITVLLMAAFSTGTIAFFEIQEFDDAIIYLEQNFTDQDTEVVVLAKGQDEGLRTLKIHDPYRRKVLHLHAKRRTLGVREFAMESPEPGLSEVLQAYHEGEYTFRGRTFSGVILKSVAFLSHDIPGPAVIVFPEDEAQDIDPDADLIIQWEPVDGAVKYLIEVEREDPEPELSMESEAVENAVSFTVSAEWLEPDSEYQVGVAVVNADGNTTWVEQTFTTAP